MNVALPPSLVALQKNKFTNCEEVVDLLQPDIPVLCFSPAILEAQARLFLHKFPGDTAYAVKANPEPRVISILFNQGIKIFDVASPTEMALVAKHAPGAHMHYHNPVKSRDEIAVAFHQYGCRRFAVDDIGELDKTEQIAGTHKDIEIAVRLRLPAASSAVHDFSTKFGAPPAQVISLLRECERRGFSPLVTFHPGSQCHDVQGWVRHIKVVAQIVREAGVKINRLNIGGGFPAHYLNGNTPELGKIFDAIKAAVSQSFDGDAPGLAGLAQLECEPGRALVASCMSLITRVKAVRRAAREVFLNDGIYGSLMETGQAPALTPRHNALRCADVSALFTVYGPTCDPLDCLPLPLKLPADICEGEYVIFSGTGAYGSATATGFNGYGEVQLVEVD